MDIKEVATLYVQSQKLGQLKQQMDKFIRFKEKAMIIFKAFDEQDMQTFHEGLTQIDERFTLSPEISKNMTQIAELKVVVSSLRETLNQEYRISEDFEVVLCKKDMFHCSIFESPKKDKLRIRDSQYKAKEKHIAEKKEEIERLKGECWKLQDERQGRAGPEWESLRTEEDKIVQRQYKLQDEIRSEERWMREYKTKFEENYARLYSTIPSYKYVGCGACQHKGYINLPSHGVIGRRRQVDCENCLRLGQIYIYNERICPTCSGEGAIADGTKCFQWTDCFDCIEGKRYC